MRNSSENDLALQERLVAALLDGRRYPHVAKYVRLIETHISWVLLAGRYAYKIKKAVDLGFLDCRALVRRQFFCNEEIRLNTRLAPHIYLDVVPIGGSVDDPVFGHRPAIESAVKMRRFSVAAEMDRLMLRGKVLPSHIDSLANVLAQFHLSLAPAPQESSFGKVSAVRDLVLQNVEEIPGTMLDTVGTFVITALQHAMKDEYAACEMLIDARCRQGFVRECHGDLHLGNIVIRRGEAVPFDGIEFDPALRWIDVMSDIAFPFMDMLYFRRPDLAYRFLNEWLEITGDYAGLGLLRFYASYRAAVRAKVNAIRVTQPGIAGRKLAVAQDAFRTYLALAFKCLERPKPALIIMHGLPGSGKTTFTQAALERFGAIRIRSDVERKRLFGLAALESSSAALGSQMYSADATMRTYAVLHDTARGLLEAGYRVIVDAAFLKQSERMLFSQLAADLSAPFIIASIQASDATLQSRVEQRQRRGTDASEADLAVLKMLQASHQAIGGHELANTVQFVNEGNEGGFASDDPAWSELKKRLD